MSQADPDGAPRPTDEELMVRCQTGDAQAFSDLYSRYRLPISRYAGRILGDGDAVDDVMQETFLRAYSARDRFLPDRRFSAWLYTIAHNLCANELRRREAQPGISLSTTLQVPLGDNDSEEVELHETIADPCEPVERRLERRELAELVRQATDQLPLAQREVVRLRFTQGLMYGDISAVLGCSLGTVKSRLHHAIGRLRELVRGPQ